MSAPNLSVADFTAALLALLPRGRAWPKDPDAVQVQAVGAFAPSFQRHAADAAALLADGFPSTAYYLLPEWEETLGLPDACAGLQPTVTLRRQQVVAKLTEPGGQSIAYFIAMALALGYVITITQFTPSRVGHSRVGKPICGLAWAHAWQVNSPDKSPRWSRTGGASAGEPIRYWTNLVLVCEIQSAMPAHTVVIFNFT